MTNVLLADDNPVIRAGLKIFIAKVITSSIIDEVWDIDIVYQKVKQNEYALMIIDATIAGTDSFPLIYEALKLKPDARILIFSINNEDKYAKKYLQLGVKGYLNKDASEPEIENAIYNVLNNKRYISASLMETIATQSLGNNVDNPFSKLSPREYEIAKLLIRGESLGEICNKLNLHSSTVGTFKSRIFEKLNCRNIIDINSLAKMYKVIPAF
jgi:Response regulator containing a CheY-like receiver domain and an HTH DNA-binding domain